MFKRLFANNILKILYPTHSNVQQSLVEKDEKEQFFQQYAVYHIVGLDNFFTKYFIKNNQLIRCEKVQDDAYVVSFLQGEALNSIAHELAALP